MLVRTQWNCNIQTECTPLPTVPGVSDVTPPR